MKTAQFTKTAKEVALADIKADKDNHIALNLIATNPKNIVVPPLDVIMIEELINAI